jgi:serine/threonine-protein kinase
LSAIHKQQLVHRDIKPSNVIVRFEEGGALIAKIIDLGLAKATDDTASQTTISTPGAFAGTPEFASPEQIAGVDVDIRSDLYSLAISLWQILTGHVPFRGSHAQVMSQHQHAPLPREELKGIAQPVITLLDVLLSKKPALRFQTPTELVKIIPAVRDAIDLARPMRKTIRIFVSSTGDVQKERNLAERVLRSFSHLPDASSTAELVPSAAEPTTCAITAFRCR